MLKRTGIQSAISAFGIAILFCLTSCSTKEGSPGKDAEPCTVVDNQDGTYTIDCPDGSQATFSDGQDGEECTAASNADGTYSITCPDGTSFTVTNGDIWGGDFTIWNQQDAEFLERFSRVTGDVRIRASGSIRIGHMRQLDGSLKMQAHDACTELEFTDLEFVGGSITFAGDELTDLSLPKLTSTAGDVLIYGLTIKRIHMPLIETSDGSWQINSNLLLDEISFPMLTSVGGITISGNVMLQNLSLPALRKSVAHYGPVQFFVQNSPLLPRCQAANIAAQLEVVSAVVLQNLDDPCVPDPCSPQTCVEDCSDIDYYHCE